MIKKLYNCNPEVLREKSLIFLYTWSCLLNPSFIFPLPLLRHFSKSLLGIVVEPVTCHPWLSIDYQLPRQGNHLQALIPDATGACEALLRMATDDVIAGSIFIHHV